MPVSCCGVMNNWGLPTFGTLCDLRTARLFALNRDGRVIGREVA